MREAMQRVWSSLSVTFARTQLLSEKHIWLKLFSHINSGKHRVNQVATFSEVVLSHIYKEMVQISCILITRSSQSSVQDTGQPIASNGNFISV